MASHYTFISTISVYSDHATRNQDETGALGALEDPTSEEITGDTYGPLKVLCEQAAAESFTGHVLVIRPGLIVGPHDPTDRFTYWPVRIARGGDVLAPGPESTPVQLIDVRDLAAWTVEMMETGRTGVFNATGPEVPLTMAQVLEACRRAAADAQGGGRKAEKAEQADKAELHWVDSEFLVAEKVGPFTELPLWLPEEAWGITSMNIVRAAKAGLRFRPILDTARDTLAWHSTRTAGTPDYTLKAGLAPEREQNLLQAFAGYRAARPV
jgi:2'-hydroxyisoflavone reductase